MGIDCLSRAYRVKGGNGIVSAELAGGWTVVGRDYSFSESHPCAIVLRPL